MRLDLAPIIEETERLLAAIEDKSWHYACNAIQCALCAMPSASWMEREPGIATYTPLEGEANRWLNILRSGLCKWQMELVNPDRTWERSDDWPAPKALQLAVENLKGFILAEAECPV